nr:hypothetical protein [uncultured Kingella sp.]
MGTRNAGFRFRLPWNNAWAAGVSTLRNVLRGSLKTLYAHIGFVGRMLTRFQAA